MQQFLKHPLWFYIKKHPRAFAFGMVSLVLTNFLDAIYPLIMKTGIDQIQAKAELSALTRTSLTFFVVMASLSITRFGWRIGFGYFHTYSAEDLRQRLFGHVTHLAPSFFQKKPVGELMSMMTNDVQSFRQAIGPGLLILADGFIMIAMVFPIMLQMSVEWTFKTLIFLPAVPFLIWVVMKLIHTRYKIQQDRFSELTGIAQETVGGIRVIKSFALENRRTGIFNSMSRTYELACNHVAKVDSMFGPVMEFGIASGSVILLFIAQDDIYTGAVSIGTFMAFHRYIQKMVWPMTALGMGLSMVQKGFASFDRMKELFVVQTDVPDQGTIKLETFEELEFKNVSFTFPDSQIPVLQNVSFRMEAGESIGLIGPVGSGKTTLLHLLTRMYPLKEGQILINKKPIETYTLESLRKIFLLIPQEPFLFSESIAENISLGLVESAPQEEIQRMTDIVDLTNELQALPQKWESQLGERGINLSGGQKQRLTLARGLILKAPVLLLDDSLSAVDTKTEEAIENELRFQRAQSRLIVAHRLSTLKSVHRLIVLREGKIEALGTPTELARTSTTYQKILALQNQTSVEASS